MTTLIEAPVQTTAPAPAPPKRHRAVVGAVMVTAVLTVAAVVVALLVGSGPSDRQRAASEVSAGIKAQNAGDLAAAAGHYREAMHLDARNVYAAYDLGVVLSKQGDATAAAKAYQQAIAIRSTYEPALFNYGVLLQRQGQDSAAIGMYQRAVQADPSDPRAHFNLGLMLRSMPKYAKDGLAQLQIAVKLDPSLVKAAAARATR